ncbi:nuclear transport factor 2 family protein [Oceanicoccus sp. KOV_DT_Chl]|uniref:YybH family protein n=1 Tax=Oceanicoccus sp. KOV_DT_Chl TaxID=1904639 RepID=UPI000C7A400C|nr:nuclear transport factor 2 family protein [Oceanicoccus sp. KOV_DT_Chl]
MFKNLTFLLLLFLHSLMTSAGGHKEILPIVKIDIDPQVEAEVTAVIHETAKRWSSQQFSSVLELWDPNEPYPTYLGEEQAQWFVGWDRLKAYLDPARPNPAVEAIRQEMFDVQVKQIAPDLAIAFFYMHFEMKIIKAKPFGEDIRASAVLRKTDKGWKYIHWAKSPKNPKVYIEDLFEQDVEPGWDEFYQQAQKNKKAYWKKKRELKKQQK